MAVTTPPACKRPTTRLEARSGQLELRFTLDKALPSSSPESAVSTSRCVIGVG